MASPLAAHAWSLLSNGEAAKSKLVLETLLHASPDDVQASLLLAHTCIELGRSEEAVKTARHAYAVKRQPAQCAVGLAVAMGSLARQPQVPDKTKQEHRSEAIQVLQHQAAATRSGSNDAWQALVLYNLAVLLAEEGRVDEALRHAGDALGACASASGGGEASAAASVAVSVLELDGDGGAPRRQHLTTLCLVLLGLLMSARREHKTALRLLSAAPTQPGGTSFHTVASDASTLPSPFEITAVAAPPGAAGVAMAVPPLHAGDVLLARLRAQLLCGDDRECGSDAQAAMSVLAQLKKQMAAASASADGQGAAASPKATEMRAEVWQELALLCASSGDHANATFCAEQALQLCPWQARAHQVQGRVHEAAGRAAAAMEAYNTALALEPRHAPSLLSLGTLYRRHGTVADLALARDLLSDALRYDARSAPAWRQLGLACRALGHREEAERNLRTAVGLAACSPALPFAQCPLLMRV